VAEEYAALVGQAQAALAAGRLDEAEPALHAILQANPREAFAWALLGLVQVRRAQPELALAHVDRALGLDRDHPDYLNLRGVALGELGRLDEAVAAFRRALKRRPAHAECHYNLGKALLKRDDLAGARESFRRAATLDPPQPSAAYMHGLVLQREGRAAEALRVFRGIVAAAPDDLDAFLQLGGALGEAEGMAALVEHYRGGLVRWPGQGRLHRALGVALLADARYAEGWAQYLRRDLRGPESREVLPAPLPETLAGRAFLLEPEQGLGDVLFFLRFAPALVARGAKVALQADARLADLLGRAATFDAVVAAGAPVPPALAGRERIPVGDLPFLVGGDPCPPLALAPEPRRVSEWSERLRAHGPGPYVGVTWRAGSGGTGPEFAKQGFALSKAIPPAVLGRALRGLGGTLVAVQRQPRPGEIEAFSVAAQRSVLDASRANDDLDDAIALLAALDRYVAVSNTNVHLRAAAGLPSDVLVPHPPEWRWMLAGGASPWFSGSRVHRQDRDLKWEAATASLRASLEE
jgi:tetratricopeptide (TPR) repeat protein